MIDNELKNTRSGSAQIPHPLGPTYFTWSRVPPPTRLPAFLCAQTCTPTTKNHNNLKNFLNLYPTNNSTPPTTNSNTPARTNRSFHPLVDTPNGLATGGVSKWFSPFIHALLPRCEPRCFRSTLGADKRVIQITVTRNAYQADARDRTTAKADRPINPTGSAGERVHMVMKSHQGFHAPSRTSAIVVWADRSQPATRCRTTR